MLTDYVNGRIPGGFDAINISLGFVFVAAWSFFFSSTSSLNVGHFSDPVVDSLLAATKRELDPVKQDQLFSEVNAQLLKGAPWLLVVNDLNPRVLAPAVHGFVMPRSWFIDLTSTWVG
jgi:peptide/nickel transport system substrate-binding protein